MHCSVGELVLASEVADGADLIPDIDEHCISVFAWGGSSSGVEGDASTPDVGVPRELLVSTFDAGRT